jgi:hypothetical protein
MYEIYTIYHVDLSSMQMLDIYKISRQQDNSYSIVESLLWKTIIVYNSNSKSIPVAHSNL